MGRRRCRSTACAPRSKCFDASHIEAGTRLWKMGLIDDPPFFDFVLGVQHALSFTPQNMLTLMNLLRGGQVELRRRGARAAPVSTLGMILGGHCRVGIETISTTRTRCWRPTQLVGATGQGAATRDRHAGRGAALLSITNS
ncbi:MAG: 3-keto-5-aminohexanoate cleavage protein [Gemmatimonadetes bacterium]|nr:3-keto-5-aminohexanoate cleavage protein [Gemmatimonadota bacterium]